MTNQAATPRGRMRLRRLVRTQPTAPGPAASTRSPLAVLRAALWFGMSTGAIEVALVLALKPLNDSTPGFFHLNRHLVWMIPLFHVTVFSAFGLVLAVLCRFRRRFSERRAAFFLG